MKAEIAVNVKKVTANVVFPKEEYPQLYSKRGFEKKRIKFIISGVRDKFILVMDGEGNTLTIL